MYFTFFALWNIVKCYEFHTTIAEIEEEIEKQILFYGSTVRLEHQSSEYFLHSHLVSYGTGSGQQSVTGMRQDHDYNSLWTFKECHNQPLKKYDQEIKCGDCVRLEHMMTGRNLHSHAFQSPFTGGQEVSAFGDDGNGDFGDDWILECEKLVNDQSVTFTAKQWFYLKHKVSNKYLKTNRSANFNQRNCGYHCPIEGQLEISASNGKNSDTRWKVYAGLFYQTQRQNESDYDYEGRHCNQYGSCDDLEQDFDEYETVQQLETLDL